MSRPRRENRGQARLLRQVRTRGCIRLVLSEHAKSGGDKKSRTEQMGFARHRLGIADIGLTRK